MNEGAGHPCWLKMQPNPKSVSVRITNCSSRPRSFPEKCIFPNCTLSFGTTMLLWRAQKCWVTDASIQVFCNSPPLWYFAFVVFHTLVVHAKSSFTGFDLTATDLVFCAIFTKMLYTFHWFDTLCSFTPTWYFPHVTVHLIVHQSIHCLCSSHRMQETRCGIWDDYAQST